MNKEEAIKQLQVIKESLLVANVTHDSFWKSVDALNFAIDVLEKTVPKVYRSRKERR